MAGERVETNVAAFAFAVEDSLGNLPAAPAWTLLEPNTPGAFGATISTVARTPISRSRQRRKGSITDLDSAVEFETDLTLSAFRNFIEGAIFVEGVNSEVTDIKPSGVVAARFNLPAGTLTGLLGKLPASSLVWASGFGGTNNNGLHETGPGAATAITIPVANLTVEAAPPAGARVSKAGYRVQTSNQQPMLVYVVGTTRATLTKAGLGTTLIAQGLTAGQFLHIGSVAGVGESVQNALFRTGGAANDTWGYGRVVSVTADVVTLDKLSAALQPIDRNDPNNAANRLTVPAAQDLDIVFGQFIRNVDTDDDEYLRRSYQFEGSYPDLIPGATAADPPEDGYEYAIGNHLNTMGLAIPLTDKATMNLAFIGTDTEEISSARKSTAATTTDALHTSPVNTTPDVARLRVTDVDELGLSTDFKSLTITLNNNVSGEKVIGNLGARFINVGNFEVNIEAQLLFTSGDVIASIRNNATVSMDTILKNDDGVIAIDIPSMTLGGGGREFPANESVLINVTAQAFRDADFGTSIGITIFPIPLP